MLKEKTYLNLEVLCNFKIVFANLETTHALNNVNKF